MTRSGDRLHRHTALNPAPSGGGPGSFDGCETRIASAPYSQPESSSPSLHALALRLITCGGSFDESTGHYQDNTVVYASVTSTS